MGRSRSRALVGATFLLGLFAGASAPRVAAQAPAPADAARPHKSVYGKLASVDKTRNGIVMKSDAARDLVAAVAAVARHEPFFSSKASQVTGQGVVQPLGATSTNPATLTKRERDVVVMVAQGHSSKEIAATLNISAKTVESHRRNIMHKLGLKSVAELVRYAMRSGLVPP